MPIPCFSSAAKLQQFLPIAVLDVDLSPSAVFAELPGKLSSVPKKLPRAPDPTYRMPRNSDSITGRLGPTALLSGRKQLFLVNLDIILFQVSIQVNP